MIRIHLADVHEADRLIEALYVAAGTCPRTPRAAHWLRLAAATETAIDQLHPADLDTHPVTTHRSTP